MTASAPFLQQTAQQIRNGNFSEALQTAETGLESHARDPDLLGLAAYAALRLGQGEKAVDLLKRQLAAVPDDKAAYFNLATALAGLERYGEALALAINYVGQPKLARLAGYLLQKEGRDAEAATAYSAALEAMPDDWESWNNLGNCFISLRQIDNAITAFENAVNRAGANVSPQIFHNLSQALNASEDRDRRLHVAKEAQQRFPGLPAVELELGLAQAAVGLMAEAEITLRRAAENEQGLGDAKIELGLLYEITNRLDDLNAHIAECEKLGDNPELAFLQAWSLRRRNQYAEAAIVAKRIPDTMNPIRLAQLHAEIEDRLGNCEDAFIHYARMNEAAVAAHPASEGPNYRKTVNVRTSQIKPLLPVSSTTSKKAFPEDPIFIVGSPRSGTTLLDTLLGGMPQLQVFEEMPMLAQIEHEFPDLADCVDAKTVDSAKMRYFQLAENLEGPSHGRRIVDKMPLHMTRMPTINRLFPDASIILVERHPCDVVLSCFFANFTLNHAMRSYSDLKEAARTYDAIFTNWTAARGALPLKVHPVRYERMIENLEAEMRPLLSNLGLPWRNEVLDNQASAQKRGPVRTASYSQIGQPLYQRSVNRWKRYRAQLEPVLPILRPWIKEMGYAE